MHTYIQIHKYIWCEFVFCAHVWIWFGLLYALHIFLWFFFSRSGWAVVVFLTWFSYTAKVNKLTMAIQEMQPSAKSPVASCQLPVSKQLSSEQRTAHSKKRTNDIQQQTNTQYATALCSCCRSCGCQHCDLTGITFKQNKNKNKKRKTKILTKPDLKRAAKIKYIHTYTYTYIHTYITKIM